MSVLTLLLYLAFFILVLLTIILLTAILPIKIRSETDVDGFYFNEIIEFNILLGFLGGKIYLDAKEGSFQLKIASIPVFTTRWINKEKDKEEKEPVKKRRNFRILIKSVKKLASSVLRRVKLQLDLDLVAGLSDPYVCGLLFGFIYPLIQFIEIYCQKCTITLTPVFIEEKLKGRLIALVRFRPILLVYPLLRFFLSREFREHRRSGGTIVGR